MEGKCKLLRDEIQDAGYAVRKLLEDNLYVASAEHFPGQHGEMKANTMLAFRHLEDARMRLGKVMQQIQGGRSKYDEAARE